MKLVPEILAEHMLPFNWDVRRVWEEEAEVSEWQMTKFLYLLELPFWSSDPGQYTQFDVSPRDVMIAPEMASHQYQRILEADVSFPIDLMLHGERPWILDGVHRVAKLFLLGESFVRARFHADSIIPRIIVL